MKIAFFTSLGNGMAVWQRLGTLSRELLLYNSFVKRGCEVHIFTYERMRDIREFKDCESLRGLFVHPLFPDFLPKPLFLFVLPFCLLRYWKVGRAVDVVKTNQGHAGIHALFFAWLCNRPLVSRSGYVLSEQLGNRLDRPMKDVIRSWLEKITMRHARACFVPTEPLFKWCDTHMRCRDLYLFPNNVDTELFAPAHTLLQTGARTPMLLAVGRLSAEKRLELLLRAAARLNCRVVLVGAGREKKILEDIALKLNVDLECKGRVDNDKLPDIYRSASVYVMCSQYEGHPKTLMEAMSCGCVCVGTDTPGVRNQIVDGVNGVIARDNFEDVVRSIHRALTDEGLRRKVSAGAREYALQHFSLEKLSKRELAVLQEISAGGTR